MSFSDEELAEPGVYSGRGLSIVGIPSVIVTAVAVWVILALVASAVVTLFVPDRLQLVVGVVVFSLFGVVVVGLLFSRNGRRSPIERVLNGAQLFAARRVGLVDHVNDRVPASSVDGRLERVGLPSLVGEVLVEEFATETGSVAGFFVGVQDAKSKRGMAMPTLSFAAAVRFTKGWVSEADEKEEFLLDSSEFHDFLDPSLTRTEFTLLTGSSVLDRTKAWHRDSLLFLRERERRSLPDGFVESADQRFSESERSGRDSCLIVTCTIALSEEFLARVESSVLSTFDVDADFVLPDDLGGAGQLGAMLFDEFVLRRLHLLGLEVVKPWRESDAGGFVRHLHARDLDPLEPGHSLDTGFLASGLNSEIGGLEVDAPDRPWLHRSYRVTSLPLGKLTHRRFLALFRLQSGTVPVHHVFSISYQYFSAAATTKQLGDMMERDTLRVRAANKFHRRDVDEGRARILEKLQRDVQEFGHRLVTTRITSVISGATPAEFSAAAAALEGAYTRVGVSFEPVADVYQQVQFYRSVPGLGLWPIEKEGKL